jgi:hypothetical protein
MAHSKPSTSKSTEAYRVFHDEWENKYCFIESKTRKPTCLLCFTTVAIAKKYNLERHYKQNHNNFEKEYPVGSAIREDFLKKKKRELFNQQNIFVKRHDELESMVKTSYEISLLLAKKKKSFSDGEIVKEALTIFAQNCDDKHIKAKADSISLSRHTVTRRVEQMAVDINEQIQEIIAKCKYFSLALDETCDLTSRSQLAIFVRCVDENWNVLQDLLEVCQLESTTQGKDIFLKIKECIEKKSLSWDKLISICTDGAPAMIGKDNGCVALLQNFLGRNLFSYHCIIHQEALCAKDMELDDIMDPVVRCINYIRAKALNRRQFRLLFEEEIREYGELQLYCAVRWLSRGSMLKHFFNLREQVLQFLEQKGALPLEIDLLKNTSWLSDLAFLVDVTNYLNILNLKLQGKDCSLPTMFNLISGFKAKLNLFSINLATENIDLFPTLKHLKEELNIATVNYSKYQSKIRCLSQSFERRFQDFESKKQNVQIFINPFIISLAEIVSYPANIQLELVELQNHDTLKNLFANKLSSKAQNSSEDFADFWKLVPKAEFPAITDLAVQFLSSFGSTYVCEKVFSDLNYVKNKYRTSLTEQHICDLLLLSTSDLSPNISKLVKDKQWQKSH